MSFSDFENILKCTCEGLLQDYKAACIFLLKTMNYKGDLNQKKIIDALCSGEGVHVDKILQVFRLQCLTACSIVVTSREGYLIMFTHLLAQES